MFRKYPSRPIVGVGVVIFNNQSVLLARRSNPPHKNELSLPGGVQEVGETIFDAAKREVFEETHLKVNIHTIVDVIDSIERDPNGKVIYHYILIDVLASVVGSTIPIAASDITEAIWVQLNDISSFTMWSETVRIINLAAEMKKKFW